jgi:hypothetical protein
MKTIEIGGFVIKATVDEDGHLTLTVDHEDGSEVVDIGEDVAATDCQWGSRFTTEKIG